MIYLVSILFQQVMVSFLGRCLGTLRFLGGKKCGINFPDPSAIISMAGGPKLMSYLR